MSGATELSQSSDVLSISAPSLCQLASGGPRCAEHAQRPRTPPAASLLGRLPRCTQPWLHRDALCTCTSLHPTASPDVCTRSSRHSTCPTAMIASTLQTVWNCEPYKEPHGSCKPGTLESLASAYVRHVCSINMLCRERRDQSGWIGKEKTQHRTGLKHELGRAPCCPSCR